MRAERPFAQLVREPSDISVAILDTVCDQWRLLRGPVVVLAGAVFHGTWVVVAVWTYRIEQRARSGRKLIAIA